MPENMEHPEQNLIYAYGTWLLKSKHRIIKKLKKLVAPTVHGDKQWNSSYLLMDYFLHNPLPQKSRVLDVGCGWGPTSIFLAKRGCKVTGLDVDDAVFAYLDIQADINNTKVKTRKGAMSDMTEKKLSSFDVITGGDICFWDELADEWYEMLLRAEKAGVKKLVLADPGRPPFDDLYEKCLKRWDAEMLEWYALEPRKFAGFLLVVDLN